MSQKEALRPAVLTCTRHWSNKGETKIKVISAVIFELYKTGWEEKNYFPGLSIYQAMGPEYA